ncbi:GbsR/MarR family transcriptional regulator [Amycolatopsis aidingensis]|uniref:GbsR/MarR family transcriptional regulator n=1 Tax=Amycolatopsis aidingensis TaxID=2842453 RepID=UPI0022B713A1|nr:MarR family transcriptional regulator [Amycolatopsis aidingensis]
MPGGRLTHEHRRRIASGLAEGLGYAQIARQLGRPTSTIAREVARNGGSESYQADRAQHATGERARRRKPAPRPEQPLPDTRGRDPEVVREFVDRFAGLLAQAGLPRMAARVLACLVSTDAGALTAAELVRRLRVSPASVSKAVGYLEGLEIIRRERDSPRRRERYLVDDDAWLRSWVTSARTNAMWAEAAQQGVTVFGPATPAGNRLAAMGRFFARLSEDMSGGPSLAAGQDALTVLAALLHAGTPLTVDQLETALGWPADRVTDALRDAERHPEATDPIVLGRTDSGACTIGARSDRLSAAQRTALDRVHATIRGLGLPTRGGRQRAE